MADCTGLPRPASTPDLPSELPCGCRRAQCPHGQEQSLCWESDGGWGPDQQPTEAPAGLAGSHWGRFRERGPEQQEWLQWRQHVSRACRPASLERDSDTSQVFSAAVARAAGRSSAVALVLMQVPSCFLLRIKGSARKSVVVPPTWVPGTGSLRTSSSFVRRTSGILAVLQAAF